MVFASILCHTEAFPSGAEAAVFLTRITYRTSKMGHSDLTGIHCSNTEKAKKGLRKATWRKIGLFWLMALEVSVHG